MSKRFNAEVANEQEELNSKSLSEKDSEMMTSTSVLQISSDPKEQNKLQLSLLMTQSQSGI